MIVVRNPKKMYLTAARNKLKGKTIGLVPTMGALHDGHLSLIHQARKDNDIVIVSIFVNPIQFGPGEDYKRYPRTLSRDISLCRKEGVDFIFYPKPEKMYPRRHKTYVSVEGLSNLLCGKSRPGHFRGVATIVAKLFNITCSDIAYFGQKDAQQVAIIKRMAEDLNLPVKIKVMPIIREIDGLALSSRNFYLSREERKIAVVLFKALALAKGLIRSGERSSARIIAKMKRLIEQANSNAGLEFQTRIGIRIDYVSIVDPVDLKPMKKLSGNCLIALAVWIGKTRLIDNISLKLPAKAIN